MGGVPKPIVQRVIIESIRAGVKLFCKVSIFKGMKGIKSITKSFKRRKNIIIR